MKNFMIASKFRPEKLDFADDSRIFTNSNLTDFNFFKVRQMGILWFNLEIVLTFKYFVSFTNSHRCMSFFNRLSISSNSKSHLALIWSVLSTMAKLSFLSSSAVVIWIDVEWNIRDIGICKSTISWCWEKYFNKTSKTSKLLKTIASKSVVSWAFNISSCWK